MTHSNEVAPVGHRPECASLHNIARSCNCDYPSRCRDEDKKPAPVASGQDADWEAIRDTINVLAGSLNQPKYEKLSFSGLTALDRLRNAFDEQSVEAEMWKNEAARLSDLCANVNAAHAANQSPRSAPPLGASGQRVKVQNSTATPTEEICGYDDVPIADGKTQSVVHNKINDRQTVHNAAPVLLMRPKEDKEHAAWLADKIHALGDYAKEAAMMLNRWPVPHDAVVPDGWQLVPKENTFDMNTAFWNNVEGHNAGRIMTGGPDAPNYMWRELLSATPPAPLETASAVRAGALEEAADFYLNHAVQGMMVIKNRVEPSSKKKAMAAALRALKSQPVKS